MTTFSAIEPMPTLDLMNSTRTFLNCTRSQGQNVRVDQLLLEPGEIGLLPIKEAADRIDQNMVGRRCSQTTGLFE